MKDGFVRVAAAIPKISVADPRANRKAILIFGIAAEIGRAHV